MKQAEIIWTGGTILTMDAARPRAEALAAIGGRLVAVVGVEPGADVVRVDPGGGQQLDQRSLGLAVVGERLLEADRCAVAAFGDDGVGTFT